MGYISDTAEQNQHRRCAVDGCTKRRREALGGLCNAHALRNQRHGSPTAGAIKSAQLRLHRKAVKRFLQANTSHPVIKQIASDLQRQLDEGAAHMAALGPNPWVSPTDWRGRRRKEFSRLHAGGATGLELFEATLSLHLFSHYNPAILPRGSNEFWFALSRALLNCRPRSSHQTFAFETGKPSRTVNDRLSSVMLRELGRDLATALCGVFHFATLAIERQATQPVLTRGQLLERQLARQPFAST
jgi:hypothetical protein